MEPGGLRPEFMKWNSTPGIFKRILSLPTLNVKPTIWDKWCDGPCAQWEPTQHAGDFRPGVALVVCYSLYQDLPQNTLWEKKAISLSIVYVPEHWILPSFEEAAYVINTAWNKDNALGIMSLARVHKKAPFFPDVSYWEYKQHLTIILLLPPQEEGLGMCGYVHDFVVGALHHRPDGFCKSGEILSWAPLAFWRVPPRDLLLITRNNSKTWGNTSSVPECHDVPMAPLDTFVQLKTNSTGQPIPLEYTFALCIPGAWPFPSTMDVTILLESYLTGANLGEDDPGNKTNSKKPRKHKGKSKAWNRSKSADATSSASEVSSA